MFHPQIIYILYCMSESGLAELYVLRWKLFVQFCFWGFFWEAFGEGWGEADSYLQRSPSLHLSSATARLKVYHALISLDLPD